MTLGKLTGNHIQERPRDWIKFPESSVSIGHDVSPQVLRNAFEFDMMYFFRPL